MKLGGGCHAGKIRLALVGREAFFRLPFDALHLSLCTFLLINTLTRVYCSAQANDSGTIDATVHSWRLSIANAVLSGPTNSLHCLIARGSFKPGYEYPMCLGAWLPKNDKKVRMIASVDAIAVQLLTLSLAICQDSVHIVKGFSHLALKIMIPNPVHPRLDGFFEIHRVL